MAKTPREYIPQESSSSLDRVRTNNFFKNQLISKKQEGYLTGITAKGRAGTATAENFHLNLTSLPMIQSNNQES